METTIVVLYIQVPEARSRRSVLTNTECVRVMNFEFILLFIKLRCPDRNLNEGVTICVRILRVVLDIVKLFTHA